MFLCPCIIYVSHDGFILGLSIINLPHAIEAWVKGRAAFNSDNPAWTVCLDQPWFFCDTRQEAAQLGYHTYAMEIVPIPA